ncbi:hypothetical protein JTB14_035644 [Gonioctena quinquepunctata]|nr:hypothetical protein JTB14_035644 [Gonioctena quinquepunctata]
MGSTADIVKHFIKGIQQDEDESPTKINSDNLKKLEIELKKLSRVANPENLMRCIVKFIDYVVNCVSTMNPQTQCLLCRSSFGLLNEIVTPELKNVFVKHVTKRILDIVIEEGANTWCMKRELLKTFNFCVKNSDKIVRYNTVKELSDMYIFKMVDSISSYGDYDLQLTVIETVFRMYGKETINRRLKELIPESQELSQTFAEIKPTTFDIDVRVFLTEINKNSGKLFSIICESIRIGEITCTPPTGIAEGIWVDFNLSESAITWYCCGSSFLEDEQIEEDPWDLITLFVSDVGTVNIHR